MLSDCFCGSIVLSFGGFGGEIEGPNRKRETRRGGGSGAERTMMRIGKEEGGEGGHGHGGDGGGGNKE